MLGSSEPAPCSRCPWSTAWAAGHTPAPAPAASHHACECVRFSSLSILFWLLGGRGATALGHVIKPPGPGLTEGPPFLPVLLSLVIFPSMQGFYMDFPKSAYMERWGTSSGHQAQVSLKARPSSTCASLGCSLLATRVLTPCMRGTPLMSHMRVQACCGVNISEGCDVTCLPACEPSHKHLTRF